MVTHLLQRVRGECRPIPACTVDDDLIFAGNGRLDSALEIPPRDEQSTRNASEIPRIRLAHVEVHYRRVALAHPHCFGGSDLLYALLRFLDEVGAGFICHESSFLHSPSSLLNHQALAASTQC